MKWFTFILLIIPLTGVSQDYTTSEQLRRLKQDTAYSDTASTPLHFDSLPSFDGLRYFKIDKKYRLECKVKKDLGPNFTMATSSGKLKEFRQYAVLKFKLNGKKHKLPIYQNIKLMTNPLYRNYLFVPFTDLTNGHETYGGGRYLEVTIPKDGEKLVIDFNQAFNPLCHYRTGWNCPIPPKANFLNTRIEAGEKLLYEDHK